MNYFAPAGSLWRKSWIFPDIQKVQALNSWILGPNLLISNFLNIFGPCWGSGPILKSARRPDIDFPRGMHALDAYLSSYDDLRRFVP